MNRRLFLGSLGLGAATLGCAGSFEHTEPAPRPAPPDPQPPFARPPDDRGPPTLERWQAALAAARLHEIAWLRDYRERGVFPHNHRVLGRTPTFIDERGRACAVGYLMQRSGYGALATTIARDDNHVYVENIDRGDALDWILFSGLTQDECAMIQPSYHWREPEPPRPPPDDDDRERETLRQHFSAVESRLLRDTRASLQAALTRLEPLIEGGASIDRIVH